MIEFHPYHSTSSMLKSFVTLPLRLNTVQLINDARTSKMKGFKFYNIYPRLTNFT